MTAFDYPQTRRGDIREVLHGQVVADPYRWLEDPDAPEVAEWVSLQNTVTETHLAQLPARGWFSETMNKIVHRPRAGVPLKRAGKYFVSRNDGSQSQDVWFVADSLEELLRGGRVIIDPNTLSADGTDSVSDFTVSPDGRYLAYSISEGGSDWQLIRLLDLGSGEAVEDAVIQTKFSTPDWLPDSQSYFYKHFDHDGLAVGTRTAALGGAKLMLHRVGQPVEQDELILEFPGNDRLMFWQQVSDDDRWLALTLVEGTENRNRLWFYPIVTSDGQSSLGEPIRLIDDPVAEFAFLRSEGSDVYLSTDLDAPRGRIVRVDLDAFAATRTAKFVEVVAQSEATLIGAEAVGDVLVAVSLEDAQPVLRRFDLAGNDLGRLVVPGGSLVGIHGKVGDPEGFLGMSSVTSPTQSYVFDADTGELHELSLLARGDGFTPPEVTVERRYATSKDGTQVPYFLIRPTSSDRSIGQPTLLWGYGGFKIPVLADYRPGWSGWLAAGGALAIANLRGGGEFGTDWYDEGRLRNKQNVFDDFVAVAEHLKQTGVTTTAQLALHGRSNGGLLVGATLTQRPDLAAVALPAVGVLDLLRFHKFTIGAAWASDYGNPDDADDFAEVLAYSPLHNVREGISYPATLILTGDHDDRVVPLHSHKFTAALQHVQAGDQPVLARIEVATGHGMGKPTQLVAAEWADLLAFAAHHTGLDPR